MNDLEKKDYYNMLYDYYKSLLTDKQQSIFESYYEQDYSLSEIAENLNISRNAVWDTLKKVVDKLEEYENKLLLYQYDHKLEKKLNELKKYTNEDGLKIIEEIREMG